MTSHNTASEEVGLEGRKKLLLVVTERDIVFNCPSCQGQLVVDMAGADMEVPCAHCGHPLTVPPHQAHPAAVEPTTNTLVTNRGNEPVANEAPARTFDLTAYSPDQLQRRLDDLKNQLKENRSQDTEMRGHVNRATMELHRLQLRLKKLQERHGDIEAELAAIHARIESGAA